MTQRVARPMKFAAFISIILSVAVLFVACQGAVGPAGADGKDGKDGTDGKDAEPIVIIPLTGRIGPVVLDNLNAGDDMNESTEHTIDLMEAGYFNGGEGPYKFTATVSAADPDNSGDLTASIDADTNMLKLKLTYVAGTTDYDTDDVWMNGYTVALTAEDANKETATSSITIKPNQAPQTATGVTADTDGVLADPNDAYVIGIQEGEIDIDTGTADNQPRTDGAASCAMFNMCELTLFADQGDFEISVESDDDTKFSWSAKDGKLTLTGLESTWNAGATPTAAHEPVEVDVTATDGGGLKSTLTFMLSVDGPPTLADNAQGLNTMVEFTLGTTGNTLITATGAAALFEDAEQDTITASFSSSNTSVATIGATDGTVTPVSRGSATFTVRGTTGVVGTPDNDGLGQYAEIEYSITVK